jgi:hypothetical protein
MSTIDASRPRYDLASVLEVIAYARGARLAAPLPDVGHLLFACLELHLHRVPLDVFHAAVAVSDDLDWKPVHHYRNEDRDEQYWTVTVELAQARLTMYSEHQQLAAMPSANPERSGG